MSKKVSDLVERVEEWARVLYGRVRPFIPTALMVRLYFGNRLANPDSEFHKLRLKKGPLLFVLAPGSSILGLTVSQWRHIRENASVSVGWWSYHSFDADIAVVELPTPSQPGKERLLLSLTQWSHERSSSQPLLVKIKKLPDRSLQKRLQEVRFMVACSPTRQSQSRLESTIRRISSRRIKPAKFEQITSTVDGAIVHAVRAGFEKVVLVGLDLDTNYYFNEPNPQARASTVDLVPKDYPAHSTDSSTHRPHFLVLSNLIPKLLAPNIQTELCLGTPSSRFGAIEPYEWPEPRFS